MNRGDTVFVLNRDTHTQLQGVQHIQADRNNLGNCLKDIDFDVVMIMQNLYREAFIFDCAQ